ncbi:beclin 1-associated autophagy-related key regulator [Anopheles bellator]|uniref:beclin 1-associated autophagy-related key regulator n=1 Tax=Anopheles bellator TaxID=139047 RepID=UPI002649565B|nr:beclin 1-associated autophagy-related key regulator [Anopheles bellator]
MATNASSSTSDSGGAPGNFHISSFSHDEDDDVHGDDVPDDLLSASSFQIGGVSSSTLRCPLCSHARRQFHCKQCIRNGNFVHTASVASSVAHPQLQLSERFGEKQQRLRNLRTANATLEAKAMRKLAKHRAADQLRGDIKRCTDKANILRKTIEQKRRTIEELRVRERTVRETNRTLRIKLPRCNDKVQELSEFVMLKVEESEYRKRQLGTMQERLRLLRADHVQELVRFIFPISQTIVSRSQSSTASTASDSSATEGGQPGGTNSRSTIHEISEATRTAYVRGQWVLQDSFGEVQHVIVAPSLPGTGNYSAYTEWATAGAVASSSGSPGARSNARTGCHNPAHTISAALTYTAQLVQLIAFVLDVRLPRRVAYADFCTTSLAEGPFRKKVARLNADIVALCYAQCCRLNDMHPTHTLENLLCLLSSPLLGHCGPTDRTSCLSDSMEQLLMQDIGEDSDSEDETIIHQEWEAVPSNLSPVTADHPYQPLTVPLEQQQHRRPTYAGPHHHQYLPPAPTSLVTSAFASVSSFWKGWTGK